MKKRVIVLGSSGSVGSQALDVIREHRDLFDVVGLAVGSNIQVLEEQIDEFSPEMVVLFDSVLAKRVQKAGVEVACGLEGLLALSRMRADICVCAMSGCIGLRPTLEAIRSGKRIALANKEVLVMAGELIMGEAREHDVEILPVDSEHSAIFQCLMGESHSSVNSLVLTASGGPFFNHSSQRLESVTVKEALAHPTWKMGAKISIDSSTMMNKGLEVIEAHHLFSMPVEKIKVLVHPESFVHSMVVFDDGCIKAQMGEASMKDPIRFALSYPNRLKIQEPFAFKESFMLNFHKPCMKRFLPLALAFEALKKGQSAPCFLNAINDVLVKRFLEGQISWLEIGQKANDLMQGHNIIECRELEAIEDVDKRARALALKI